MNFGLSAQLSDPSEPLVTATRDYEPGETLEITRAFGGRLLGGLSPDVEELTCRARNADKKRSGQKVITTGTTALCMSEEHEKNTRVYIKADSKVPDLYILTLKAISAIQQGDPIVHTQRAIPEILQAFRFLSGSVLSARGVRIGTSENRGLGVFTTERKGLFYRLEVAPVVQIPRHPTFTRYGFTQWERPEDVYMPFGIANLINDFRTNLHYYLTSSGKIDVKKRSQSHPNVLWGLRIPHHGSTIGFLETTIDHEISADSELFTRYGTNASVLPSLMKASGIEFKM